MITNKKYDKFKQDWQNDIASEKQAVAGNKFAEKLFSQWKNPYFDISDDLELCYGAEEGSIDATYKEQKDEDESGPDKSTIFLITSTFGNNRKKIDLLENECEKIIETIQGRRKSLHCLNNAQIQDLQDFSEQALNSDSNDRFTLVICSEDPLTSEEELTLEKIRENIKYSSLFQIFDVVAINLRTLFNNRCTDDEINVINVPIRANLVQSSDILLIGSVTLINVFNFLRAYEKERGDSFNLIYKKNVRMFLGGGKAVNKGIADTIRKKPELFGLFNNGITIVVEDYKKKDFDAWELTQPYIVNGCQTTRIVYEELKKKLEGTRAKSAYSLSDSMYIEKLKKGTLVVKIVKAGGEDGKELLKETTKHTNSQNVVSVKDFISLEEDFHEWAKEMESRYGVFLEMQRGEYKFKKDAEDNWDSEKWANGFELIKIYGAAWLDEPGTAYGYNHPFAPPKGVVFKEMTKAKYFGVDELYAAYVIFKLSEYYEFGKPGNEKRHPTKYLFSNVVIRLLRNVLNDARLPHENNHVSQAVISIFMDFKSESAVTIADAALAVIDDYMSYDKPNSMSKETKYTGNSNAFLKNRSLGKSNWSPILLQLIDRETKNLSQDLGNGIAKCQYVIDAVSAKGTRIDVRNNRNANEKRPTQLNILDQKFQCRTWKDVLVHFFEYFADSHPEKFAVYAANHSNLLSRNQTDLNRSASQVKKLNNGYFIETHLSSTDILRKCNNAASEMGLRKEEWNLD